MKLVFRNWTYEIEYSREIIRICVLFLIFGLLLLLRIYGPTPENEPIWFVVIITLFVAQIPFYWIFSLLRFLQISINLANAIPLETSDIQKIRHLYPKDIIYLYNGKHYFALKKNRIIPNGKWILVHIGKRKHSRDEVLNQLARK